MIENLTPEAERRLLLKDLALTEVDIGHFRKLPGKEARWRIEHECRAQVAWTERRRDFLLAEGVKPDPKKPKPPAGGAVVVVVRRSTISGHGTRGAGSSDD